MKEKEFYRSEIIKMVEKISNLKWLMNIYSFVKVLYNDSI